LIVPGRGYKVIISTTTDRCFVLIVTSVRTANLHGCRRFVTLCERRGGRQVGHFSLKRYLGGFSAQSRVTEQTRLAPSSVAGALRRVANIGRSSPLKRYPSSHPLGGPVEMALVYIEEKATPVEAPASSQTELVNSIIKHQKTIHPSIVPLMDYG
jgi:hypothetical protein